VIKFIIIMATLIVKTIGTVGADYPTLAAWKAAQVTGNNLVALDEIHLGRVITNLTITSGFSVGPSGGADATRYVILESLNGSVISLGANIGSNTMLSAGGESYLRRRGLTLDGNGFDVQAGMSTGDYNFIHHNIIRNLDESNCRGIDASSIDAKIFNNLLYLIRGNGSSGTAVGIRDTTSSRNIWICQNTIDDIDVTGGSGDSLGISTIDNANKHVYGNIITRITNTGGGGGVNKCYQLNAPVNADYQRNSSDDTTASGAGSIINNLAANIFVNAAGRDYHEIAGSSTRNAGGDPIAQYGAIFDGWNGQTDLDGIARPQGAAWDMGVYEFVGPTPGNGGGGLLTRMPPRRKRVNRRFGI
jgi:hypothetical protein